MGNNQFNAAFPANVQYGHPVSSSFQGHHAHSYQQGSQKNGRFPSRQANLSNNIQQPTPSNAGNWRQSRQMAYPPPSSGRLDVSPDPQPVSGGRNGLQSRRFSHTPIRNFSQNLHQQHLQCQTATQQGVPPAHKVLNMQAQSPITRNTTATHATRHTINQLFTRRDSSNPISVSSGQQQQQPNQQPKQEQLQPQRTNPRLQKSPVERLREKRSASLKKREDNLSAHRAVCHLVFESPTLRKEGGSKTSRYDHALKRSDEIQKQRRATFVNIQDNNVGAGKTNNNNNTMENSKGENSTLVAEIQKIIDKIKKDLHDGPPSGQKSTSRLQGQQMDGCLSVVDLAPTQINLGQTHISEWIQDVPALSPMEGLDQEASLRLAVGNHHPKVCEMSFDGTIGDFQIKELPVDLQNLAENMRKSQGNPNLMLLKGAMSFGGQTQVQTIKENSVAEAQDDGLTSSKGTATETLSAVKGRAHLNKENILKELESLRNLTKKYLDGDQGNKLCQNGTQNAGDQQKVREFQPKTQQETQYFTLNSNATMGIS